MKKIKLLTSIAALMPLSMVLIPLTSCNKNPGETEHIVEPTEEEKTKNPNVGDYYATYSILVKDGSKNSDITIEILNDTTNGDTIKCFSHNIVSSYLILDIGFTTIPSENTSATFDIKISNAPLGWSKTITNCKLTYTKPAATNITVTTDASGLFYCGDKIQFIAKAGGDTLANLNWTVSDTTAASVEDGWVTILKPGVTFTVTAEKEGFTSGTSTSIIGTSVLDINYNDEENIILNGFKSDFDKSLSEWTDRADAEFGTGKLVIPASINTIADEAFGDVGAAKTPTAMVTLDMSLATGLKSIGKYAFSHCSFTNDISIPNSVTSMSEGVFARTRISKITFSTKCPIIPKSCCESCQSLITAVIPEGCTEIGDNSFYYCLTLTTATLPSTLNKIGVQAFRNTAYSGALVIPSSVTHIGDAAFNQDRGITYIDLSQFSDPSTLEFGTSVFSSTGPFAGSKFVIKSDSLHTAWQEKLNDCGVDWSKWYLEVCAESLYFYGGSTNTILQGFKSDTSEATILEKTGDTLVVPKQVKSTSSDAFNPNSSEKIMPDGITKLRFQKNSVFKEAGQRSFANCKLTDVIFPETTTDIDMSTFSNTDIQKISIGANEVYTSQDGDGKEVNGIFKFNNDVADTLWIGTATTDLSSFTSLTTINDYAYCGRKGLSTIDIPNTVTAINKRAFEGSGLTSIKIPSSMTADPGVYFLRDCSSLATIDLTGFTTVPSWTNTSAFSDINSGAANKTIKVASGTKSDWETLFTNISKLLSEGWTVTEV